MKKSGPFVICALLLLTVSFRAEAKEMSRFRMGLGFGLTKPVMGEWEEEGRGYVDFMDVNPRVDAFIEVGFCPALSAVLHVRYQGLEEGGMKSFADNSYTPVREYDYNYTSTSLIQVLLGGRFYLPFDLKGKEWFETEYPEPIPFFVPYLRYAYGVSYMAEGVERNVESHWWDGNNYDGWKSPFWKDDQILLTLEAALGIQVVFEAPMVFFVELSFWALFPPERVVETAPESTLMGSPSLRLGLLLRIT